MTYRLDDHLEIPWTAEQEGWCDYKVYSAHPTDGKRVYLGENGHKATAELMALAPAAPHECNTPNCPGPAVQRRLDLFDDLVRALDELMGAEGGEPGDSPEQRRAWAQAGAVLKEAQSASAPMIWTSHTSECAACGNTFRLTMDYIQQAMKNDPDLKSAKEAAEGADYCLECVTGDRYPGEKGK